MVIGGVMFKIGPGYTEYYDLSDPNYPGGKAVPASTPESMDGTNWRALWFNDLHGAKQAVYIAAFNSLEGISDKPDTAFDSDFLKAILKLIEKNIKQKADNVDGNVNTVKNAINAGQAKALNVSLSNQNPDSPPGTHFFVTEGDFPNIGWATILHLPAHDLWRGQIALGFWGRVSVRNFDAINGQWTPWQRLAVSDVNGVVPVANGGTGAGSVTGPNGVVHNLFPGDFAQVPDIDFFIPALSGAFAQTGHISLLQFRDRILSGMAPLNSPAFTGTPAVPAKLNVILADAAPPEAQQTAIATEGQLAALRNAMENNVPDNVMTTDGTASSPDQVVSRRTAFENHRLFTQHVSGTRIDVSSLLEMLNNNIQVAFTNVSDNPSINSNLYQQFNLVDISGIFNVSAIPVTGGTTAATVNSVVRILAQVVQFANNTSGGATGFCFLPMCILHDGTTRMLAPTQILNLQRTGIQIIPPGSAISTTINSEHVHIRAYRNNVRMSS